MVLFPAFFIFSSASRLSLQLYVARYTCIARLIYQHYTITEFGNTLINYFGFSAQEIVLLRW